MLKLLEERYADIIEHGSETHSDLMILEEKIEQAGREAEGFLTDADQELLKFVRSRLKNMQDELMSFGMLIGDTINRHVAASGEYDSDFRELYERRYLRPRQTLAT